MKFEVIDNFLPVDLVNELETTLTHHQFPWYWRPSTTYGTKTEGATDEDFQFVHLIYYENKPQSEIFGLVGNLLYEFQNKTGIEIKDIHKIKANLLPKQSLSDKGFDESVHIDIDNANFMSLIYYVTESDGDTVLFDGNDKIVKSVTPKKGTAVYFPSNMKHRATPPILNKRRIVLNIILEV